MAPQPSVRRRRLVALCGVILLAVVALALLLEPDDRLAQDGVELVEIQIDSEAVGKQLPTVVVIPEGTGGNDSRPLLVFLHYRGGDEDDHITDEMNAALAEQGDDAPIVAFPYGGDHSYWHDRASGDWGTYVMDEVIPRVTDEFDADPKRVAIGGISMGGFGALDLARLNPGRFCAVGGHSPALTQSEALAQPGAFDDPANFAAHDVVGSAQRGASSWQSQPVWVDIGEADPFLPGTESFAAGLEAIDAPLTYRVWPGGHDELYWSSHWDSYMSFYASALRDCQPSPA